MKEEENVGLDSRLLAMICRLVRQRTQVELEKLGLHLGQDLILFVLWETEGITQSELAERVYIKPPTLARALNHMEQNQIIRRETDPDDKRLERVYLTEKGAGSKAAILNIWQKGEAELFAGFDEDERTTCQSFLRKMYFNLFAYSEDGLQS